MDDVIVYSMLSEYIYDTEIVSIRYKTKLWCGDEDKKKHNKSKIPFNMQRSCLQKSAKLRS